MKPTKLLNLLPQVINSACKKVSGRYWFFIGMISLTFILSTTDLIRFNKSNQSHSFSLNSISASTLIVDAVPILKEKIIHDHKKLSIAPKRDVAINQDDLKPYEEPLPNKTFEPESIKIVPTTIAKFKIEPVGITADIEKTWQKNAIVIENMPPGPQIAIVIDDAGVDQKNTAGAIALPAPITIAFLTYGRELKKQVNMARKVGHEILVHMAMEPFNKTLDPGPDVLLSTNTKSEILKRLRWGLGRFNGYVGINNHMGSRFTSDPIGMGIVMAELKRRGLLFLDSRTSSNTVGASMALVNDVPFAERSIFLDNIPTVEAIYKQLGLLEIFAQQNGYAVAIGHPREATIIALSQWLAVMAEKGFVQVPISAIVAKQYRKNKIK
jgi:polysaccharide deacetylase 2 family uncharacterized protein YibQ